MTAGEDEITRYFAAKSGLDPSLFPIGIGDDMAQIRLSEGVSVLITTDMLLDGTHFDLHACSLEQAARKAVAVSLSDCAAMATRPLAAVASVALPPTFGQAELKELHAGILAGAEEFGCGLIGGDITSWKTDGRFAISVAMLSTPGAAEPVRRSGAKPGDCICVSGSFGGSHIYRDRGKHLEFTPRVAEALEITRLVDVNALIDVTDGLSSDLHRICSQSRVGATIDSRAVPISNDAKLSTEPLNSALNDGEDFELLFTLSPDACEKLLDQWSHNTPITRIGTISEGPELWLEMPETDPVPLIGAGYDHLKRY